jgi:hypothetical protein
MEFLMKCILSLLSLIWITDAYAYLDPGNGSLIIQSAIAAIAGGLFVLKTYWYKLKAKLFSKFKKADEIHDEQ